MFSANKNRVLYSLLAIVAALSSADAAPSVKNRTMVPRLVINILIDQFRSDYMKAFMPLYGEDGFKKLLEEGKVYNQAEYSQSHPDIASAAASLSTGTSPLNHGIIARQWLDRLTLRPVLCVDDAKFVGCATKDCSSPGYLSVSTIGDELKVATEGKSLVYAIAPFRETAILTAGHAANGAVWIDDYTGNWCSSSYYGALPSWAVVRSQYNSLSTQLNNIVWEPSSELVGTFSYFLSGGMKSPFKHKFIGDTRFASYKTSGLVNGEVIATVKDCLNSTTIGNDGITDYLAVTLYAGNFEHSPIDVVPMELQDTYVRLDKAIADLLTTVDAKIGLDNSLFVFTSTGYTNDESGDISKYRIPTGVFDMQRAAALLNMYLVAIYGQGQYVESCFSTQIYLNHKLLEDKQINISELLNRSQDFLFQLDGIKDVYTSQRLLQGAWTPGINKIRNGYNQSYSGDITIEIAPGWRYVNEETGENKLVRESYVPFPIIFYGYGIVPEIIDTPISVDYIAPTLSSIMRIRAPNACKNAPLAL